jgi:DNA end-binding protein Ku
LKRINFAAMAPVVWKGYISFGLVSVPIYLVPAARSEHIQFHQLHKVCHTRLKQPLFCPHCDRIVNRSEVEKGYEFAKGEYIRFDPAELRKIEPPSAEAMEIAEFVQLDEVDPLYFDTSYYVAPTDAGVHAYHLLRGAMQESGYAGIAKVTMHNREYAVIIRARDKGLTLHTMYYPNEVREAKQFEDKDKTEVRTAEKALALQLIKNLAGHFHPEKYHDSYQESLKRLIEAKAKGKALPSVHSKKLAPVIDLMSALKRSVERGKSSAHAATQVAKHRETKTRRKAG